MATFIYMLFKIVRDTHAHARIRIARVSLSAMPATARPPRPGALHNRAQMRDIKQFLLVLGIFVAAFAQVIWLRNHRWDEDEQPWLDDAQDHPFEPFFFNM